METKKVLQGEGNQLCHTPVISQARRALKIEACLLSERGTGIISITVNNKQVTSPPRTNEGIPSFYCALLRFAGVTFFID